MIQKFLSILITLAFIFTCVNCTPKAKTKQTDAQKLKSGISDQIDQTEPKIKEEDKTNVKASLPLPE